MWRRQSLCWALLLLVGVNFLFGVVFMQLSMDFLEALDAFVNWVSLESSNFGGWNISKTKTTSCWSVSFAFVCFLVFLLSFSFCETNISPTIIWYKKWPVEGGSKLGMKFHPCFCPLGKQSTILRLKDSGTNNGGSEPYSRLFWGWGFPYISRITYSLHKWRFLHFRSLTFSGEVWRV